MAGEAQPDLVEAWERVGRGITWLSEHDPAGAFHIWWQSGLTPSSPMPAHRDDPEYVAAWRAYYKQRRIWEQLWDQMVKLEKRDGIT